MKIKTKQCKQILYFYTSYLTSERLVYSTLLALFPAKYVSFLSWFHSFCATIPGLFLMDLPSLALWGLQHKSDVDFIILWKGLTELLTFPGTFIPHNFRTSETLLNHRGKFLSLLNYLFIMTLKSEPCRKLSCLRGSSWDRD